MKSSVYRLALDVEGAVSPPMRTIKRFVPFFPPFIGKMV
jgi:hypothetical protein